MSDQDTAAPEIDAAAETAAPVEDTVPASRFAEVAKHKKASDAKVKELERKLTELQASLEDRESQNLPELERERKQRERLEQQVREYEQKVEQAERTQVRASRERLVLAAAARMRFDDPDDALRYPEHVNLDDIETVEDAERALKRLAKAKPKLLAGDDPQLPGKVLANGRTPAPGQAASGTAGKAMGLINSEEEASAIAGALAEFRKTRAKTSITFDGT